MTDKKDMEWDDYLSGDFLKADGLKSEDTPYICKDIVEIERDGNKKLRLTLEESDDTYIFDLNKTNTSYLKNKGMDSEDDSDQLDNPKEAVGKVIYFKKVMARNPKTKKEVPSLRISKVADSTEPR